MEEKYWKILKKSKRKKTAVRITLNNGWDDVVGIITEIDKELRSATVCLGNERSNFYVTDSVVETVENMTPWDLLRESSKKLKLIKENLNSLIDGNYSD